MYYMYMANIQNMHKRTKKNWTNKEIIYIYTKKQNDIKIFLHIKKFIKIKSYVLNEKTLKNWMTLYGVL